MRLYFRKRGAPTNRAHPPNPPQVLSAFAVLYISDQMSQQSVSGCGPSHLAGQGRAGQGGQGAGGTGAGAQGAGGRGAGQRAGQRAGQAGQGRAGLPRPPQKAQMTPMVFVASRQRSHSRGGRHYSPGASVGASSAHANGQRRSRQFRV